jgi:hypothetical protein
MRSLVPIFLFGWLLVSILIFASLRGRRAALACGIIGCLFLPVGGVFLPGLPDYAKGTAIALGLVLGVLLFDSARLSTFRPRWFDLPVVALSVLTFFTSISNGIGPVDGISCTYGDCLMWAVPYFVGRLYFTRLEDLREFALGLVISAVVYAPLCWLEMRLSPQLHTWVYGYYPSQFIQSRRYGGFRPTVFMNHGLAVAAWMSLAAVAAVWMRAGGRIRLWGIPDYLLIGGLLVTAVFCKSMGPVLLMAIAILVYLAARLRPQRWLLYAVIAFPVVYVVCRISGLWSFSNVIELSTDIAGKERGDSLKLRVESENVLIDHTMARPLLGWGGWGRNRPSGKADVLTDGLWIILFSQGGFLRLAAYVLTLQLPAWLLVRRLPARTWLRPSVSPAIGMALITALVGIDCLFNAGWNPVVVMAMGAVAGVAGSLRPRPSDARRPARRRARAAGPDMPPPAEVASPSSMGAR